MSSSFIRINNIDTLVKLYLLNITKSMVNITYFLVNIHKLGY